MRPSPRPPQPAPVPERPATIVESDEDVRQALRALKSGQAISPVPAAPVAAAPESAAGQLAGVPPYRPTLRPPMAVLVVFDDGQTEGEIVRIRADRFVIGRTEGDLLIPHDPLIAGRHVELLRQPAGTTYHWIVTDLPGTSGLFIRVSRTILADKAEFIVGRGRYRLELSRPVIPETLAEPVPPSPSRPTLVEVDSAGGGARVPLANSEYWIGSDSSCAICRTDDPFVEGRHVRLFRDARGWTAENNHTKNGLWLKVPQITVDRGCLFQIGEQRFRLTAGE